MDGRQAGAIERWNGRRGSAICEHGEHVPVMVKIQAELSCDGVEKWRFMKIDRCIAPIVKALQREGIDMRGSCCGHGLGPGKIDLVDGRTLTITESDEASR